MTIQTYTVTDDELEYLAHYGVPGMKWGQRRALNKAVSAKLKAGYLKTLADSEPKGSKSQARLTKQINKLNAKSDKLATKHNITAKDMQSAKSSVAASMAKASKTSVTKMKIGKPVVVMMSGLSGVAVTAMAASLTLKTQLDSSVVVGEAQQRLANNLSRGGAIGTVLGAKSAVNSMDRSIADKKRESEYYSRLSN